ncbi:MAG: FIST N-terminal domain-containing protein [Cyanobacteriota/Melainabacteria group bacterium]
MTMKWASAICSKDDSDRSSLEDAVTSCLTEIKEQMEDRPVDFLLGFVSSHFRDSYEVIPELVKELLAPGCFIGCSAGGLIGGGKEIEQERSVAFTAAYLPDVELTPFHLVDEKLPDLDESQEAWQTLMGVAPEKQPAFVMIPDPFSFSTDVLVKGLDFAYPEAVKIGGLASGALSSGQNGLFLNDRLYNEGLVGLTFSGNVVVDTVVAQGCKPVGRSFTITRCKRNILYELDGEPAIMALKEVIDSLGERDKELIKDSIFMGIVMDEMKSEPGTGDFLVRNILGIEPISGALVVGEILDNQKTVQFHVRDAASSALDLRLLLKEYRDQTLAAGTLAPRGALLFSCLGRGVHLYQQPNHDSECFKTYLGPVPLGGFFCNGEIGPVGSSTFLHGYTSSFGIFRERF